jgi:hypothetical protein
LQKNKNAGKYCRYIPAHPVDRYTFKKWDTNDWARHNENKYFQVTCGTCSIRAGTFSPKTYMSKTTFPLLISFCFEKGYI